MGKLPIKSPFKQTLQLLFRGQFLLTFDQLEFCLTDLSMRKRLNLFAQGIHMVLRSNGRIGFPPILQIEPVNICNLRCLTCATGSGIMKRRQSAMPFENFQNVIDQVKDYVCLVAFWSWGEPFINKDACRMIRYAKDNGLLVHTSTNGHFFKTRERAREVIGSGLDSLIVAVDGLDQPTYEKYRKGGKFENVIKSIENLVTERNTLGAKTPLIIFRFIVMKHNEHQLNQVENFATNLGVDIITLRSAVIKRGEINLGNKVVPSQSSFQMQELRNSTNKSSNGCRRCHRPYANLTIFSDGTVVACEEDYNAMFSMGNVSEQSLRDIFSSNRLKHFLSQFRKNIDLFPFCKTCDIPDSKYNTHNVKTLVLNKDIYDYVCKA
jgi:radical SAM protein with 4Fe4S-binding SPASM domain